MIYLILTVQPSRNKTVGLYRLGFDMPTSSHYFKNGNLIYLVLEKKLILKVKVVCGPPPKKAYDVNDAEFSCWIKKNKFHCYPAKKPIKLIFSYTKRKDKIYLTHYKNAKDLKSC